VQLLQRMPEKEMTETTGLRSLFFYVSPSIEAAYADRFRCHRRIPIPAITIIAALMVAAHRRAKCQVCPNSGTETMQQASQSATRGRSM
jgi:hypothetical protein